MDLPVGKPSSELKLFLAPARSGEVMALTPQETGLKRGAEQRGSSDIFRFMGLVPLFILSCY